MNRPNQPDRRHPNRRTALCLLGGLGIGTTAFQRALAQEVADGREVTPDMVKNAEWVAGITLTEEQREEAVQSLQGVLRKREQLRQATVDYDTLPALRFDPEMFDPDVQRRTQQAPSWLRTDTVPESGDVAADASGDSEGDLLFASVRQLGAALRAGRTTSVQLATLCLERLKKLDPILKCVVTLTEDLAYQQAECADTELAAGHDRGPLHGIPWGAKDLIAVAGYPTTWGAPQFREQVLPATATVANRLEAAGAVLVAKLSLGALAMGDRWFGGQTRNPWNPEQGSSGSSAGSAAAVAAGAVPFAIGSETLGSIVSPSRRCGTAGLRPTFGRVSRRGCMALSWSMDKLGPLTRYVDDCGLVFDAIHGADFGDPVSVDRWFDWPMNADLSALRVGSVDGAAKSAAEQLMLDALAELGANIVSISLPSELPEWAISLMLDAEAATVFHDLTAADQTEGLNRWPSVFRKLHFLSAVDYLHAARLRTRLMQQMTDLFRNVDLYVGGDDLGICNLTGHPTVVMPVMMSEGDHPQPVCATMTGRLHDEATLLAVGCAVEKKLNVAGNAPTL
ncbi:MAG: amidase [Fuerstiella sp.]